MKFTNKLPMGAEILKARLFKRRLPLIVSWAITCKCNYDCIYCSLHKKSFNELSTMEALKAIKEMKQSGTKRISFTGGEPLLRQDIDQLIHYAKKLNISVTMNSNGALLKEKISKVKELDHISISFDGPKKVHEIHRPKGSYKKAIEGVKVAKKNNIKLSLLTVITKYNLGYLNDLLEIAKELETPVLFQPVEYYLPLSGNIKNILPEKQKLKREIMKISSKENIMNSKAGLRALMNPININYKNCGAGKIFCRIDPDGNMYPCGRTKNRTEPPNIRNGFLKGFQELKPLICNGCYCAGQVEANLIFGLNLNSIIKRTNYN